MIIALHLRCSRIPFAASLLIAFALSAACSVFAPHTHAETFYVSPAGDNANEGTRRQPWQTLAFAAPRLNPGDRLLVMPGDYHETQTIFVRRTETEPPFRYLPIESTKDAPTIIRSFSKRKRARIFGHFDVRGSHIVMRNLDIIGDSECIEEGIGIFESHHITIQNCIVRNHGGGGIQFNHCDVVRAVGNACLFNATTNPSQQSGISCYQPVKRTTTNKQFGVVIADNICVGNRNLVPTPGEGGSIFDGNGIVLDDNTYSQPTPEVSAILSGNVSPELSSGTPEITVISTSADQQENDATALEPYSRKSLVKNNFCFGNGARGIQLFKANKTLVSFNVCIDNFRSPEIQGNAGVDENGVPFFSFGEITMQDTNQSVARGNIAISLKRNTAAAAELFFDTDASLATNRWYWNLLLNFAAGPSTSVSGTDTSDLGS
jgi:hypothetical protein